MYPFFCCIASNLLNLNDIIADVPDDPEVQWRAVPSLREIWAEERQRMADLLPPKDNFLSGDSISQQSNQVDKVKTENLPFTLSVKKGADRPGSLLALIGSRKLFESSPGLEIEFKRALADIMLKHSQNLNNIETIMNDEKQNRRAKKISRTTESLTKHHLGKNELCDLQTLLEQFTQDKCIPLVGFTESQAESDGTPQQRKNPLFISVCNSRLSQSFKFAHKLSQEECINVDDDLNFFQKLDLEELHNDTIDPLTLTHYEDIGNEDCWTEEENMNEDEFEQCLTMLATQHQEPTSKMLKIQEIEVVNRSPNKELTRSAHHDSKITDLRECINDGSIRNAHNNSVSVEMQTRTNINVEANSKREGNRHDLCCIDDLDSIQNSANISGQSPAFDNLSKALGGLWHLKKTLPIRGNFFSAETSHALDKVTWYSMVRHPQTSVSWLGYGSCESFPYRLTELSKYCVSKGGHFQPIFKAPSSSSVHRWMSRKRSLTQSEASEKQTLKVARNFEDEHGGINSYNRSVFNGNEGKEVVEIGTPLDTKIIGASEGAISHFLPSSPHILDTKESSGEIIKENATHSTVGTQSTYTAVTLRSSSVDTTRAENHRNITDTLLGIGHQAGKLLFHEGAIKASVISPSKPVCDTFNKRKITIMSIEVHVQCRRGKAGKNDSRDVSMQPDPSRDPIFAICYGYAIDPGGGEKIQIIERGCIFVPTQNEVLSQKHTSHGDSSHSNILSLIGKTLGCSKVLKNEVVCDERQLLLRLASIVRWKDPDVLTSWDTQGGGVGYLIQRGLALRNNTNHDANGSDIDMVRLLGRTPRNCNVVDHGPSTLIMKDQATEETKTPDFSRKWEGSILGAEWDERVGAGAGPSSIIGRLVLNCWRIISEEVNHPNASYQQAVIWTVLKKRLPFHDDLLLTNWYGSSKGVNRWRVLKYRLCQAIGNILLLDALDIIGRAGEAARLSGVELSQSFPGIRGSQYKVEGVLLRALQSIQSDERGEKRGKQSSRPLVDSFSDNTSSQSPWKVRRNLTTGQEPHGTSRGKRTGYFFFSPSKSDCNTQEALECQALTLEPKSGFHFDPVVVCDFTALYPSLIIAYNLCYSTIAGKLEYHSTRKEMRHQGKSRQA